MGTAEGRRALEDARLLKAALVGSGWVIGRDLHYAEYEGGTHSEQAWADRAGAMLTWLFGDGGGAVAATPASPDHDTARSVKRPCSQASPVASSCLLSTDSSSTCA